MAENSAIERPILMSAPMVLTLLAGAKTQTRRVVKPTPPATHTVTCSCAVCELQRPEWRWYHQHPGSVAEAEAEPHFVRCPYGVPGDRLWVKETFLAFGRWVTQFNAKKGRDEWHFIDLTQESGNAYQYTADMEGELYATPRHRSTITPGLWKRPAIFMPRAASRILLEVTDVRVERLQDISEEDAKAEGCEQAAETTADDERLKIECGYFPPTSYAHGYRLLWDRINGRTPGATWADNPWCWAVSFRRLKP